MYTFLDFLFFVVMGLLIILVLLILVAAFIPDHFKGVVVEKEHKGAHTKLLMIPNAATNTTSLFPVEGEEEYILHVECEDGIHYAYVEKLVWEDTKIGDTYEQ